MFMLKWNSEKVILTTWAEVEGHKLFQVADVFERVNLGKSFGWIAV